MSSYHIYIIGRGKQRSFVIVELQTRLNNSVLDRYRKIPLKSRTNVEIMCYIYNRLYSYLYTTCMCACACNVSSIIHRRTPPYCIVTSLHYSKLNQ